MEKLPDYKKHEDALFNAERDCLLKLCEILGVHEGRDAFISVNKGLADCVVFDIGSPETGDVFAFPANTYHWRGKLDIYNRDRKSVQRSLMRLVAALPTKSSQGTAEMMPPNSNVSQFRLAPIPQAVSEITTAELKVGNSEKTLATFTASATFDIIFNVQ